MDFEVSFLWKTTNDKNTPLRLCRVGEGDDNPIRCDGEPIEKLPAPGSDLAGGKFLVDIKGDGVVVLRAVGNREEGGREKFCVVDAEKNIFCREEEQDQAAPRQEEEQEQAASPKEEEEQEQAAPPKEEEEQEQAAPEEAPPSGVSPARQVFQIEAVAEKADLHPAELLTPEEEDEEKNEERPGAKLLETSRAEDVDDEERAGAKLLETIDLKAVLPNTDSSSVEDPIL